MQVGLNTVEMEFLEAWRMYRSGDGVLSDSVRHFLDRLAVDAGLDSSPPRPTPDAKAAVRELSEYVPQAAERLVRSLPGIVFGSAVGDMLGAPVEFDDLDLINRKFGGQGVVAPQPAFGLSAAITDDTQLLAFTLEGLIAGRIQLRQGSFERHIHPRNALQMSYARWLHTQGLEWRAVLPIPLRKGAPEPGGWLVSEQKLHAQRSPDRVNLDTLAAFARATDDDADQGISNFDSPLNQEKTAGALVRALPCYLWSDVPERVFNLAANAAVITHGHPTGYLPSGFLATVVGELSKGISLEQALEVGLTQLRRWEGCDETRATLERACELGEAGLVDPRALEVSIGLGWHADEALGIGIACALAEQNSYGEAVKLVVNRSGNSTTPAAVCGALLAARHGVDVIPDEWMSSLDWRKGLEVLVADALSEFATADPPSTDEWFAKYPPQG